VVAKRKDNVASRFEEVALLKEKGEASFALTRD
jgi:hypothetical protein